MGFDVLYLPPIHPIGEVNRKGANNTTTAGPDDVGSPWGIADHLAVHPDLGTLADVKALGKACRKHGLELAIDIAFQCTPDHPWVTEHPEWFAHRADGTIQYAENPPKKYQDIYPIDFESSDWKAMWEGLADVIRFWIDQGITIFRVDNPHTKAFAFWEWAIGSIRGDHPETIFLAEAFTRPRVMERLAKIGFNQSYTYFTWRREAWELRQYFTDLATRTVDYVPAQRLAQHARHPQRPAAVRRAGDVRQPGDPGRHAVVQLGHLRAGVRAARAPSHQGGCGGVPRFGEVPTAHLATRRPRLDRPPDHPAQPDPALAAGVAATCAHCASTTSTPSTCCATRRPIHSARATRSSW